MDALHLVMTITLASLGPVAIGAMALGMRIHTVRHARGACDCGQGE
jgi:hypothetical protein